MRVRVFYNDGKILKANISNIILNTALDLIQA